MKNLIRKDNLTDLVNIPPSTVGASGSSPTLAPQSSSTPGKPASSATSNNGDKITLGKNDIKGKELEPFKQDDSIDFDFF